jgi:hypothetical protein
MDDDTNPTLRGEHLGEEMHRLRDAAKLTLVVASKHVDVASSTVSLFEHGKRSMKFEDVAGLLAIYDVHGEQRKSLLAVAREADKRGWTLRTSHTQQIRTLRRLEDRATKIVEFQPLVISGLLQTIPYMQAAFTEVGDLPDDEAERRLTNRLQRQHVLRYPCPEFIALIGEDALHHELGGPAVLGEQLRYLIEASQRPKIHIRVVPNAHRGHSGLDGPFMRFHIPGRGGVVHLENRVYSQFLEEKADVTNYDKVIEQLLALALDEGESVRLIASIADELEGEATS